MKLWCPNGCPAGSPYKTEGFQRQDHERDCPTCGTYLLTGMERNARKKASANNGRLRYQSPQESAAFQAFHQIVTSFGCWAKRNRKGHVCSGRVEAHHLIERQWLRRIFSDLPESRLLELMYDPVIGAPLCSSFHAAITAKRERIYFEELDRELVEMAERLDVEYPGRGVLARLGLECPMRGAARRAVGSES